MDMTNRFGWQWEYDGDEVGQITDNGEYMDTDEIIDKLNKLYNENIELKKLLEANEENKLYIKEEDLPKLKEELDLLRKENKNLFKLGELQKEVDEIKKDYLLSVFQEHAQKYNYESNEHKIIREIAEVLGLSILLIGDKNNRI